MVGVEGGDELTHRRAQRTRERCRGGLDDRDLESEPAGGRGDLGADEPAADDDEPATARQVLAQRACVVERAQNVNALQAVASGQGAGGRPGGHHDAVGANRAAVGQPYRAIDAIQPDGTGAEQPLRTQLLAVRLEHEVGLRHLTGEELLGQRRPVVRAMGLVADDDEPSVVALRTQRAGGRQPGE